MRKRVEIRKYGDNRTIWVEQNYLMECTGLLEPYLRKKRTEYKNSVSSTRRNDLVLPVTGKSWRWGKMLGGFYYDYDFIPTRAPKYYRDNLPTETELLEIGSGKRLFKSEIYKNAESKLLTRVSNMLDDNDIYHYTNEKRVAYKEAVSYARSVAWIEVIKSNIDNFIQFGFEYRKDFLECVASILKKENNNGLKLGNVSALRRKVRVAQTINGREKLLDFVLSKKYGNDNARVIGKEELIDTETGEILEFDIYETLMYSIYMMLGESTKMDKVRLYEDKFLPNLENLGLRAVSQSSFNRYTEVVSNKFKMTLERDGYKHFNDKYMPYVSANKVKYSNSLWVADGSGSKLSYVGSDRKIKTLYKNFIIDARSLKIVGWTIEDSETPKGVLKAFKRAFKDNKIRPKELITDNGPAYSGQKNIWGLISEKHRPIKVGNSQENPAENVMKLFVNMCKGVSNWANTSYNAKNIKNHHNPDYREKNNLPSKDEAYFQLEELINIWNAKKGKDGLSPNERYEMFKNPNCEEISEDIYRYVFGEKTELDISYMRGFVNVTKHGKKLQYTIPNYPNSLREIAKATGFKVNAKVQVCFDESIADLYSLDGKFIMSCESTKKASKTITEANREEAINLKKLQKRKNTAIEEAIIFKEKIQKSSEAIKIDREQLNYANMIANGSKVKDEHNKLIEDIEEENYNNNKVFKQVKQTAEQRAIDML